MKSELVKKLKTSIGLLDGDPIIRLFESIGVNSFEVSSRGITIPAESIDGIEPLRKGLNDIARDSETGRVLEVTEDKGSIFIDTKKMSQSYMSPYGEGGVSLLENFSFLRLGEDDRKSEPREHSKVNPTNARGITQGEAGVTVANSNQPIIGSFGAGRCVIAAVYNPETKTAALAHIDAVASPYQAMELLKDQVSKDGKKYPLEVTLATNQQYGNKTLEQLKQFIEKTDNMRLSAVRHTSSLAMDSRSGEVFTHIAASQLDSGEHLIERMKIRGLQAQLLDLQPSGNLPIRVTFDGGDILNTAHHESSEETMSAHI